MAVQNRADNDTTPLILSEDSVYRSVTIAQDAQRTTPLVYGTVMAEIAATRQWVPWNAVVGVDGSSVPRGIYLGSDIPAADLVDGDVEGKPVLVGNATVNESRVIFDDDTLDADTVISAGTVEARTGRAALAAASLYLEGTIGISEFEN